MSNLDEGHRRMVTIINGGKTDKVEPILRPGERIVNGLIEGGFVEDDGWVTQHHTASSVYHCIAESMADTVVAKQEAYGDSFGRSGEVLKILYPAGIPREAMEDALTVVRVVDKLFRVATKKDAFGESPWRDVVGYGLLAIKRDETKKEAR